VNDTFEARLTERLGGVWRAPVTRLASTILAFVTLLAVIGPWLSPWAYDAIDWAHIDSPPSTSHWFGTDTSGRDLFTRICMGARTSLSVAALATAVSFAIGLPWGAVAGYLGGRADQLMMRIVDVLYALPFLFVVIVLVVVFGRNIYLLFVALGAISWLDLARIVRGQTLSIRHETYVLAAQGLGATTAYIVRHHVARNVMGPALVYTTLTVPGVLLAESFLSFLGLGVQEPDTSWGVLIADGARDMESSPWLLVFPALFLAATLWSMNLLGDRLRDVFDPRHGVADRPKPQSL
jgi:oligopeptide transport system permease protein